MKVKVKKLHPEAQLPVYATEGAACFDLHALDANWNVNAKAYGAEVRSGQATMFNTGLAFEVPEGHVMLVFSRSGHGFKNSVRLVNCVGVIDSDYRGEVAVKLFADGYGSLKVYGGDRIAQAMIVPVDRVEFELSDELGETERGEGGFGSTGS